MGKPTLAHGYAVTLLVQQCTHLGERAASLRDILNRRGLHEEGIVAVLDPVDALLVRIGHKLRIVLHELVHLLVRGVFGVLRRGGEGLASGSRAER